MCVCIFFAQFIATIIILNAIKLVKLQITIGFVVLGCICLLVVCFFNHLIRRIGRTKIGCSYGMVPYVDKYLDF